MPTLKNIHYNKAHQTVTLTWSDNNAYILTAEFLRVHSPSAEVRGHGEGQETLQYGKANIGILNIEQVGHYAIKITFEDLHDTGLYNWTYLLELCQHKERLWQAYLDKLHAAGLTRESSVIQSRSI